MGMNKGVEGMEKEKQYIKYEPGANHGEVKIVYVGRAEAMQVVKRGHDLIKFIEGLRK